MKKLFLITLFTLFSTHCFSQTSYKCFESENGKIKLSLKLVNKKAISVKYKGQKESMSLLNVSEHSSMGVYMASYEEIYNGNVNGNYDYRNEGKGYETLEYSNNNGKFYEFKLKKTSKNECY